VEALKKSAANNDDIFELLKQAESPKSWLPYAELVPHL